MANIRNNCSLARVSEREQTWTLEDAAGGSFDLDQSTASGLIGFDVGGTVAEIHQGFSDRAHAYYSGALFDNGYREAEAAPPAMQLEAA